VGENALLTYTTRSEKLANQTETTSIMCLTASCKHKKGKPRKSERFFPVAQSTSAVPHRKSSDVVYSFAREVTLLQHAALQDGDVYV